MSRNTCLLCSSESEFNTSVTGNYSRKTNLLSKIQVCLHIHVNESDIFNAICHNCVHNIEQYYDFIMHVKKAKISLDKKRATFVESCDFGPTQQYNFKSYVREQVYDIDYSFFGKKQHGDTESTETKNASAMFSYLSPEECKEPPMKKPRWNISTQPEKHSVGLVPKEPKYGSLPSIKDLGGAKRNHYPKLCDSRDIFGSLNTQEAEERNMQDWKLTPDDNIIKRLCDRHFGSSDF